MSHLRAVATPGRDSTQLVQRQAVSTDDCFAQLDAAFDLLFPGHTPSPAPPDTPRSALEPLEPPKAAADEWRRQIDAVCDKLDAELARSAPAGESSTVTPRAASTPEPTAISMRSQPRAETTAFATRSVDQPEPMAIAPRPVRLELAASRTQSHEGHRAIERLLGLLENLSVIQRGFGTRPAGNWAAEDSREVVARIFADAHQLCVELDLPTARVRADFAMAALADAQLDRVSNEAGELIRHLRHDLQSCAVWPVPKGRLWSLGLTLDDHVKAAFPASQADVAEGGMCFGFGRYTACVFHMLRAAEPGMRALARAAGITKTVARDQDWGPLLSEIETSVRKINSWPSGASKSAAQDFFDGAIADAKALVEAARKLAGGVRAFDEPAALNVCDRTTDFLGRLSERTTEAQKKALGKRDFAR